MTKLKQFPLMGFAAVIAATLGMFLLLYWHVYNTVRVPFKCSLLRQRDFCHSSFLVAHGQGRFFKVPSS